jgi:hypothetical protein|tara:strand:- start:1161 stop:2078 length:918 start_codon:yes stop_codon:yes gene_type:complete
MSETTTQRTEVIVPEYIEQPTEALANTLQELMRQQRTVPQRQVVGFTPTQQAAFQQAFGGIGSFQPFLDAAQAAQTAGLGTIGAGAQTVAGADFGPGAGRAFMDPYQQAVTQEALKEVDRQAAMAQNQLAGQAVKAGAFGGSRFGIQQSELARNAQDLKSRRIFEDLSRNFQQAQGAARAANQQRIQAGQVFGQLGRGVSGIGGAMAGLGAQQQALQGQDVNQLMGIGGLQQQLLQSTADTDFANRQSLFNAPFQQLSSAAGILQQLSPQLIGQQTVAPLPQTNPFVQAAGLTATAAGGLGALLG